MRDLNINVLSQGEALVNSLFVSWEAFSGLVPSLEGHF
jgi:hypothetical protein